MVCYIYVVIFSAMGGERASYVLYILPLLPLQRFFYPFFPLFRFSFFIIFYCCISHFGVLGLFKRPLCFNRKAFALKAPAGDLEPGEQVIVE
ncbi:hypothetical protein ACKS0A_06830 [Histoplasma ohiense]